MQAFADEPAFLVDALGAGVEVVDLQMDAVQAGDVEGIVHDLATHDRPVSPVVLILPGGEPSADLILGEPLVSAGQTRALWFGNHRPDALEMLAAQRFQPDPGAGQDRLVTKDVETDHRPSQAKGGA